MSRKPPSLDERLQQSALAEAVLLQDPINDYSVAGLGEVALVDIRTTGRDTAEQPQRLHRLYTAELDGYRHAIEVTDPVGGDPAYAVFSFPGLTEHIRGGIRQKMHSHTTYAHPRARVVSVESDGIGSVGDRYSWSDRHEHGLDGMGERGQRLVRLLAGKMPVILHGTSMGAVRSHRTVERNMELPPDQRANIQGLVWLTPAVVDPKHVPLDMALRFPTGLAYSLCKSFVRQPAQFVEVSRAGAHQDFDKADIPALTWQIIELLHGTPIERTRRVVEHVRTVVIAGEGDSLRQQKAFQEIAEEHPDDQLKYISIAGKGHELGAIPRRACQKMQKESRHLVEAIMADSASQAS